MNAPEIAVISTGAALVSGLLSAFVNTWLATRATVSEELRVQRLKVYPPVWERTGTFSRWPRTSPTRDDLARFHGDLRDWYFAVGGLFMSENSRSRYGDMQELVAAELERLPPTARLLDEAYEPLMEACSAFRTALTEDLESRRQGSVVWLARKRLQHRRQSRAAARRLGAVKGRAPP